jgi:hypothetical protein
MSRSGYTDECYGRELAMWRGQVASAIRGKRGQAFLREMVAALDAMPEKRLIAGTLRKGGEVCAIGAVGVARGVENLETIDPEDYLRIARVFGIAHQLVQEIEYENDDDWYENEVSPERRWSRMRRWAASQLTDKQAA